MFILNRKVGERLILVLPRCELTLTVTAIERDKVRLGISAPARNAVNGKKIHEGKPWLNHRRITGSECREGELSPTMFDLKE